jgi:hypothetical protein
MGEARPGAWLVCAHFRESLGPVYDGPGVICTLHRGGEKGLRGCGEGLRGEPGRAGGGCLRVGLSLTMFWHLIVEVLAVLPGASSTLPRCRRWSAVVNAGRRWGQGLKRFTRLALRRL